MIKGGLTPMKNEQKFIVTTSQVVANQLVASGVKMISNVNDTYVFINELPKNFSFDSIDTSLIAYTNILSL